MRSLNVVHRTQSELRESLLVHLAAGRHGMDAAELAVRVGCGAGRVRALLESLERSGAARREEHPSGARWKTA